LGKVEHGAPVKPHRKPASELLNERIVDSLHPSTILRRRLVTAAPGVAGGVACAGV